MISSNDIRIHVLRNLFFPDEELLLLLLLGLDLDLDDFVAGLAFRVFDFERDRDLDLDLDFDLEVDLDFWAGTEFDRLFGGFLLLNGLREATHPIDGLDDPSSFSLLGI